MNVLRRESACSNVLRRESHARPFEGYPKDHFRLLVVLNKALIILLEGHLEIVLAIARRVRF